MAHTDEKLWYRPRMAFRRQTLRTLSLAPALLVGAVAALGLAGAGCDEPSASSEAQASTKPQTTDEEAPDTPGAGPAQGQPSYEEEAFALKIEGPSQAKVGETVTLEVKLEAQGGYKVNEEYPIKFKFASMKGAAPEKDTVRKQDGGEVSKTRATLPLRVKVGSAGQLELGGQLSFSVCTDERCLIEKRDLLTRVNAS